jgi:hypothetical protein
LKRWFERLVHAHAQLKGISAANVIAVVKEAGIRPRRKGRPLEQVDRGVAY